MLEKKQTNKTWDIFKCEIRKKTRKEMNYKRKKRNGWAIQAEAVYNCCYSEMALPVISK